MKKAAMCFAQRQEKELLARYPDLEEKIPLMLDAKRSGKILWPEWCYVPMAASYAIVTGGAELPFAERFMANGGLDDLYLMSAIIPWRVGRPVYRFDDELAAELMRNDASEDDVPVAVLMALPFPCVCIEHPAGLPDCECLYAFLEYDTRYPDAIELRMHYAFPDETVGLYLHWTAARDKLNAAICEDNASHAQYVSDAGVSRRFEECHSLVHKHLNLVLYLCSEEPEIKRDAPIPRRRGADNRQKVAAYPDKIEVGTYIGAAIRRARAVTASEGTSGGGTAKRPHVRRAHWHLYWTGEGRKTPKVKWVMPVFVHADSGSDIAIIRDVVE